MQKKTDDIKKREEKQAQEQLVKPLAMGADMKFPGPMGGAPQIAAIMPAPGMMQPGGMGMRGGMPPQMNPSMGMPNMGMNSGMPGQQNPFGGM